MSISIKSESSGDTKPVGEYHPSLPSRLDPSGERPCHDLRDEKDIPSVANGAGFPSRLLHPRPGNGQQPPILSTYITYNGATCAGGRYQMPTLGYDNYDIHLLQQRLVAAQLTALAQMQMIQPPVTTPKESSPLADRALTREEEITRISRLFQGNPISKDCCLFRKTYKEFNIRHPFFDHVFISAAIFAHHPGTTTEGGITVRLCEPRLLLLKRSAHDPNGYANRWEMPGGACTNENESILNGLAREVFFQTHLSVSRIVRQVDKGHLFSSEYKVNPEVPDDENWYKPCIEVQSMETEGLPMDQLCHSQAIFLRMPKIPVVIRKELHQNWSWLTKAGVQYMLDGQIPGEQFVNTQQGRRAVMAFEARDSEQPSRGRKRARKDNTDSA